MRNPKLFYKASGKFNPMLVVSPVVLFPLSLLCAFIYTYASIYVPIVGIVTVILLGGFTFLTGICCFGTCNLFKVRNKTLALLFGLLVGAFTLHASWAAFIFVFFRRFAEGSDVGLVAIYINPLDMWAIMKGICADGWFSIGSSGGNVSGIPLAICWVIEAGVILIGPIIGVMAATDQVFCEQCNEWAEEEQGLVLFNLPLTVAAIPKIKERGVLEMKDIALKEPNSDEGVRLDACVCHKCKELYALSLTKVEETVNDKGEFEKKEESLLKGLLVNQEQYKYLKDYGASGITQAVEGADGAETEDGDECRQSISYPQSPPVED